jgi:hypothetical protein
MLMRRPVKFWRWHEMDAEFKPYYNWWSISASRWHLKIGPVTFTWWLLAGHWHLEVWALSSLQVLAIGWVFLEDKG